jgi:DNA polymerase I-like protein with 3'-5' exonuclease and polymerase domains
MTTILGRRSRFDLFEPVGRYGDDRAPGLPFEQAVRFYGRVQRGMTHKALNRKLQGSAADLMKYAMLKCWEDGLFAETGVPRLTVHDELDFSDPGAPDSVWAEVKRTLETALPLRVPVVAEMEVGADWGNLE